MELMVRQELSNVHSTEKAPAWWAGVLADLQTEHFHTAHRHEGVGVLACSTCEKQTVCRSKEISS